jgi:hypothetical protein
MRMNGSGNSRRFHVIREAGRRGTPATVRRGPANSRVLRAAAEARRATAGMAQCSHVPRRPWWTCYYCQAPWPCVSAKRALAEQLSASALAMYMTGQMAAAVRDMPRSLPGALWTRFLAWTRSTDTTGHVA